MTRAARALLSLTLAASAALPAPSVPAAERPAPLCVGRYADALAAMSQASRGREGQPAADWVYCLRATAVYENVSYGRGGKLRRHYQTKVRHGTGFAYRQRGGEWLVATNDHVVSFPEVTGDGIDVDGVPPGSRRVRQEVRIVANEADPDSPDQAVLTDVVRDEPLDVAVLASRQPLKVLPYRLGRSTDLRVGNAVLVRGFPLGAFPAANGGRVIALGQHDTERGWDHEDFAVDALLNLGSSGSPVLAVSCETGEPEVVGIYHAGYRGAQGLNVVIGVDQLRPVLEELRPPRRPAPVAAEPTPDPAEARTALARGAIVMPFGGRAVRVERAGSAVRFSVLDSAFPLSARVDYAIVDRGHAATGRAAELRDALWTQLGLVLRYRAAEDADGRSSRSVRDRIAAQLRDRDQDQQELLAAIQAGADGLALMAMSDGDAAPRTSAGHAGRVGGGGRELVLGAR